MDQSSEHVSKNLLLSILATGGMAFIGILTETLMNVLFPELMEEFHISTTTVQWLTTSYLLVVALVTPLSSYFKRKITMKTIFIIAMILCLAGSLLAACTLNFPMLLSARVLQGTGTGMALPLMFNIILEQSPKSKIGMLMGIGNLVCATAPALGPTVGGLVGTFMSWRWIFVITFAFLVIFMILGLISIRQVTPTVETHLNPLHVLCIVIAFVSFIFAVERGGLAITALSAHAEGAARALILPACLLVVCIVTLVLFAWMSRRSFSPLVRLGVLRSGPFRWHLLAYVLLQAITIGFGYMIPNSCQLGYGVAPLIAGVLVLPGALLGAAAAPVAGSLLDRYGAARPIIVAMSVAVLGVALMVVLVGPDSNMIVIGTCYFIYMLGFSMCFANTMTSGMGYIAPQFKSDGNAVFSTFQQLAGAVGTTVMSVFLGVAQAGTKSGTAEFAEATISGAHWGYVALLIVAALALLSNLHALMLGRRITVH